MTGRLSNSEHRGGVTLVELLVTITILAIIGSAVLFASFGANRAARIAATQAKVASLHSLVTEKYDEFQTRRPEFQIIGSPPKTSSPDQSWFNQSEARLKAIRMLMRMEMPDRWSDIVLAPVENNLPTQSGDLSTYPPAAQTKLNSGPDMRVLRSTLSLAYLRRYDGLRSTDPEVIKANQGAECLYMIVTLATADGEALGMFRESDIGDVDGDGAPEFLDAWGQPIFYLFAAPGFTLLSDLQTNDPVGSHDPFDAYRIDGNAFRLVPLIYSAGPDGNADLVTHKNLFAMGQYPYAGEAAKIGLPLSDETDDAFDNENDGENWHDNIHNHDQNVRQ